LCLSQYHQIHVRLIDLHNHHVNQSDVATRLQLRNSDTKEFLGANKIGDFLLESCDIVDELFKLCRLGGINCLLSGKVIAVHGVLVFERIDVRHERVKAVRGHLHVAHLSVHLGFQSRN